MKNASGEAGEPVHGGDLGTSCLGSNLLTTRVTRGKLLNPRLLPCKVGGMLVPLTGLL